MVTPIKWGEEFLVNSTKVGRQDFSTIASLPDGRFIVAFDDYIEAGGDTPRSDVRAQLFDATGAKTGAEFLVNTITTGHQFIGDIAALADGRILMTWSDGSWTLGSGSQEEVRAQIFESDGTKVGAEFLANTSTNDSQFSPSVTSLTSGGFVITWTDSSQTGGDTSSFAVRAQVFDSDSKMVGSEFLVNTTTPEWQLEPTVSELAGGRFVITWYDSSQTGGDTSSYAVRAQIFDADGGKVGAEFLVNTTTNGAQTQPDIAALKNGGFVVSWRDSVDPRGIESEVRAQVFDAEGSKFGEEFQVNTTSESTQYMQSICGLADGRFVVVWVDDSGRVAIPDNGCEVRGQVFNPDGTKSGEEFLVNTTEENNQDSPFVSALPDGRFVVSW